jgi:uncharacterized membrane protein
MSKKVGTPKSAIIIALVCTIFTAAGQLFFKIGSAKVVSISTFFNLPIILGAFSYLIGSVLFIIALKKGELSVIVPLLALNFIWVGILSSVYLGEAINSTKWLGIISIVIGISFIGRGGMQ